MMIIIEGPDGAGKTTLAQEFVKLGFEYRHEGVPKPGIDMFEWYTEQILSVEPRQDVVFDRFLLSEYVYGQVVRGGSAISLHQLRLLLRLFYASAGVMVLCTVNEAQMLERWRERKDKEYVQQEEQLKVIRARYEGLLGELRPDVEAYNAVAWPLEAIKVFAANVHNQQVSFLRLDGIIGRQRPSYLVIGERSLEERDLVFYSDRKSAGFLNECLWEAGYRERELAFMNAKSHDSVPNEIFLPWRELGKPTVLALGRVAQQTCISQGVPHLALQHPQYVKRFKQKQRSKYVQQFRVCHRNF